MYAKAFEDLNFDSVTVVTWEKIQWSPCLWRQTYNYACLNFKWRRFDFQTLSVDGKELYKHTGNIKNWKNSENLMYVVVQPKQNISQKYVKLFQIVSC
jgi:orotidine-5'-phosphate decarboxylase